MNIINDSIVSKLLPFVDAQNEGTSSIRLLGWTLDENLFKSGDIYTSQLCRLWLTYEHQGARSSRSFFVKIPINSPAFEIFKTMGSYDEEIIVYTKILPAIYQFEKEHFTPRLYYSDEQNKTLVLEDLSQSGFKCIARRDQLDFEHCYHALRSLAKLHGLSAVVGNKNPEILHWMKYQPEKSGDPEFHKSVMDRIPMYIDSLSEDIKQKYPDQVLALRNLSWSDVVEDYLRTGPHNFCVFGHGDFWTNNIMFKYNDTSNAIVQNVRLIDFQFGHWGNPAVDIIHFAITSMRFEVYQEYFNELLRVYVDTLNEILVKYDCPTYSMELLLRDIAERYRYACLVFTCILPVNLAVSDERGNVEKGDSSEQQAPDDAWTKALKRSYKEQLYIDVSTKWLLHFIDRGFLHTVQKEPEGEK
ncbi:uncharacterized protein LOC135848852 [Planococcus citri]|uniref:uncharacterized protein LOC135848852 n=1 Tax=Planococcus citri TaxID=170843 RepID=UPI0031F8FB53